METSPLNSKSLKILFIVLLFFLGSYLALIAIVWDWFKNSEFKQNPSLPVKSNLSVLIKFLGVIFALNILSPFFIHASSYLSLDTFEVYVPFILQALIVILATHKLLHENNVFFTNPAFWDQFKAPNWVEITNDLALKDFLNPDEPEPIAVSPAPESTQQAQTSNPILVDQSEDKKRIYLIVLALIVLLMFLAYYYFFDLKRIATERAEQVFTETLKAEGEGQQ